MVSYREILRLRSLDYSQRQVAVSVKCSRNTVSEVYRLADEKGLSWPLPDEWSNTDLQHLLYPEKCSKVERKMPDLAYLHKELAKSGVTMTLLWSEYCEQCKVEKLIPYQYTQFCDYYRAYAMKTKATMRIKRKPGELLEVDWAGSVLSVHENLSGEIIPAYIFVALCFLHQSSLTLLDCASELSPLACFKLLHLKN